MTSSCARECPLCGGRSEVVRIEDRGGETYRRRQCKDCGFRYTTLEKTVEELEAIERKQKTPVPNEVEGKWV